MRSRGQTSSAHAAIISGGLLGSILLVWLVVALFAPGFASVVAVFGSPVFACLMILRLLTLPAAQSEAPASGPTLSHLEHDAGLLERVAAAGGGVCRRCGSTTDLRLRPVLPIGSATHDLERRFIAVCAACDVSLPAGPRPCGLTQDVAVEGGAA